MDIIRILSVLSLIFYSSSESDWCISPTRRARNSESEILSSILGHIGWVDDGLGAVPILFLGCDGMLISSAPKLFDN